jgi:hypothetical protein
MILFAAEESGLLGSQAWLKRHPDVAPKVVMMINRDGSPMALTGVRVPETWYADFQAIAAPLAGAFPKWPFKVDKTLPRAHATAPGGSDHTSFEVQSVPTLQFATETDYVYSYAWHTLNDLYSELVPYTEQQQESAVVHAVMAYGVANLDKPLTRAGFYLDDGLYAAVTLSSGEQFMTSLDFVNAPLYTANFLRIVEGNAPAAGGRGGMPPMGGAGGGRGGQAPPPVVGKILAAKSGLTNGEIVSDTQKKFAVKSLPKQVNGVLKHDTAGVFGMQSPNAFYITQKANAGFDKSRTALGKVIAGGDVAARLKAGDTLSRIQIVRVGKAASEFKADDESFKKLLDAATGKKKTTTN